MDEIGLAICTVVPPSQGYQPVGFKAPLKIMSSELIIPFLEMIIPSAKKA
jgi:hypothetical protein